MKSILKSLLAFMPISSLRFILKNFDLGKNYFSNLILQRENKYLKGEQNSPIMILLVMLIYVTFIFCR